MNASPLSRRDAIARFGGGLGTLGLLASLPGVASVLASSQGGAGPAATGDPAAA